MSVEPSSPDKESREEKRSRLRWPVRLLAWGLVAVAGLALVVWLLVGSDWLRDIVRAKTVAAASEALGREVMIEGVELELVPPTVEFTGVVVGGDARESAPLARLAGLRISVGPGVLGALLGTGPLVLAEIDVSRPEVVVVSYEDGTSSLPTLPERGEEQPADLAVRVGALYLAEGTFRLDERSMPLDFEATGLAATLRQSDQDVYSLRASSERLELATSGGTIEGSMQLQAELSDDGVALQHARLSGARLSFEAAGEYKDGELALDLSGSADLAVLASLGVETQASGLVAVDADLRMDEGDWRLEARLEAPTVTVSGVQVDAVDLGIAGGSSGVALEIRQAELAKGRAQGSVTLEPPAEDGELGVDLAVEGIDLAEILALLPVPENELVGSVSGELTARFPLAHLLDGEARLDLEVVPPAGLRESTEVTSWTPVQGDLRFAFDQQTLTVQSASLVASRQRISISGTAVIGDEIDVSTAFEGVDLGETLRILDSPVVGLEGEVSGELEYRFPAEDPVRGSGRAAVRVEPSLLADGTDLDSGSVPLQGSASVVASGGVLELEEAVLESPNQRIASTGRVTLDGPAVDLSFGLETRDPKTLLRLLPVIYEEEPEPLWEPSAGSGTLTGSLQADAAGFRTRLQLELESAVVTGSPVARVEGMLDIDSGGIQELDLVLSRANGSVQVRGALPFDPVPEGFVAPEFQLSLDVDGWNLGDAEPWLDLDLPVDGMATARVELAGAIDAPEGRLDGRIRELAVEGTELAGEVKGSLAFDPELLEIEEARLVTPAGELRMTGTYGPMTEQFGLELATSELDLASRPFADWTKGVTGGTLRASAVLEGTLASPSLVAEIVGSGLAVGDQILGEDGSSEIELGWREGELEVSGSLIGLLSAEGGGRLSQELTDLEIRLASDALPEFVELVTGEVPEEFAGSFAGSLVIQRDGESSLAEVRIDPLQLSVQESRLENIEPVVISLGSAGARIESFYLAEQGTGSEIFVVGDLGSADKEMDLRVISSIDVAWLNFFLEGMELSGRGDLLAIVGGSMQEPRIDGQAELSGGRLIVAGFPHAIESMHGFLFFYPKRVVIDSGRARIAGGELLAEGEIASGEEEQLTYEMRFAGNDLDIRYPDDWRIRGDGRLVLTESPSGRTLSGTVELESAVFVKEFQLGFTQLVRSFFQRRPELVEETDELLVGTRLNIAVEGPGALHIQTDLAELRGDLDFAIRGTLAAPVVLGEINLTRGGEIGLGGTDYRIERGVLTFANPFRNDPRIDLVASTNVQGYQVRLNVFGPADDLRTSLSSNPPLSNLDIVSLLTTGSANLLGEAGSGLSTGERDTSAEAFLAGQAASLAGERVGSFIGLDQVQISPLTGGSADLSAARITVGRRISRDVFVTYSYDPSESEEGIFELRWQVYPSISLVLTRSDDGSVAADLRWDTTF